jgi:hypothetical protein
MARRSVSVYFQPLTQWPRGRERTPATGRERAKFKTTGKYQENNPGFPTQGSRFVPGKPMSLERTLDDLDRELYHIDAKDVVVQVDVENERNFRQDGGIRADARTKSPAIVVSFVRNKVPTVFATDHFDRWTDNLRAIVLGMEALRKLDRYHIVKAGDQYRGWQALPSATTAALSTEAAARVIAARIADVVGGIDAAARRILAEREYAKTSIRSAAARSHPDAGGREDDFKLVQEAKRVLEAHHGGAL